MADQKSNQQPMAEEHSTAYHRLRRLQEHTRSNIPAMIAQRSGSSFTLQEEPIPHEALDDVAVVVYPQDPFVGEPEVRYMSALDIRPGLINSRIRVQDAAAQPAQPDADGNYLYWPDTAEFAQINSFYYTNFTLRMYERYARRSIPWSFPLPRIIIDPHAGNGANAFYSEHDRLLGFHRFTLGDETVHTAHSADIVSHEAAHAILDGLRDLYNESFGLGPTAFHESFGDMTAVLVALHDDTLVRRLLEWTKGDLRMDNFIAAVAEQMTHSLMRHTQYVRGHTVYLRNALNSLVNKPFDELSYTLADPQLELGRQSHNYSRLFTGAFYDILVGIYERIREDSPAHLALHRARDILGQVLTGAVELGPVGEFDFSDMARAFLASDTILFEGRHTEILMTVFDQRRILAASDARAFLESQRALPELQLPETLNSALASALFLEEKVMPALNLPPDIALTPMAALRNAVGMAYLTYFSTRRIMLEGEEFKEFQGAAIDAFGGLTLGFDADGRLISAFFRPVTDEDVRQIRILTAELVEFGLITEQLYPEDLPLHKTLYLHPNAPHALKLQVFDWRAASGRDSKLVKYPVIVDNIPASSTGLLDYLQAWLRKARGG